MLAYLQCDPKVLRSLHCGKVQHVDYVSNGGNGSEVERAVIFEGT